MTKQELVNSIKDIYSKTELSTMTREFTTTESNAYRIVKHYANSTILSMFSKNQLEEILNHLVSLNQIEENEIVETQESVETVKNVNFEGLNNSDLKRMAKPIIDSLAEKINKINNEPTEESKSFKENVIEPFEEILEEEMELYIQDSARLSLEPEELEYLQMVEKANEIIKEQDFIYSEIAYVNSMMKLRIERVCILNYWNINKFTQIVLNELDKKINEMVQ